MRQIVLLAVLLPLSCGSVRMIAWWLLAAAPVLAFLAADRFQRETASQGEDKPNLGAALSVAGLLAAMLLSLPWFENWSPYRLVKPTNRLEDDLEAAAQRMRQLAARGRTFTRFEWSEYLTWSLGPDYPVFMDGRIEIFPNEVWDEYSRITGGSADWDSLLRDKYGVEFLLIDQGPYHGRLRPLAEGSRAWEPLEEAEGPVQVFRRAAKK